MNYPLQDRKKKKNTGFGFIRAIGVFLVLVFIGLIFSSVLPNFLHNGSTVSEGVRQESKGLVLGLMSQFSSKADLQARLQDLLNENAQLKETLLSLDAVKDENAQLKELFGRKTEKEDLTLSAVISRPPESPYDTLVLDAGNNVGFSVGDLVYAHDDIAIGTISEVYANSSIATLFSSSGQKHDVIIGSNSGSSTMAAVAEGAGGGNLQMKLPHEAPVAVGDYVTLPDLGIKMLGIVEKLDGEPGGAYIKALFKIPVAINNLRYVEIKKNIY